MPGKCVGGGSGPLGVWTGGGGGGRILCDTTLLTGGVARPSHCRRGALRTPSQLPPPETPCRWPCWNQPTRRRAQGSLFSRWVNRARCRLNRARRHRLNRTRPRPRSAAASPHIGLVVTRPHLLVVGGFLLRIEQTRLGGGQLVEDLLGKLGSTAPTGTSARGPYAARPRRGPPPGRLRTVRSRAVDSNWAAGLWAEFPASDDTGRASPA